MISGRTIGTIAGAVGILGVGVAAVALMARQGGGTRAERDAKETAFTDFAPHFMQFDTSGDGRIDRTSEVLRFSDGGIKTGPSYASLRAAADGADMIVGNRDGFATSDEFAALARTYTERVGATGLNGREASVFSEDYGIRSGDGGTPETMRGNPYF